MYRDSQGWTAEFKKRGAFFIHDGKPRRPHPLLTSGKHSNGFVKSEIITGDEVLLWQVCSDMVDLYSEYFHDLSDVDRVVGPATGATKLAEALSDEIAWRAPDILTCDWASPKKFKENGVETMRFDDPQRTVLSGEQVLPCEDVLTTGKSLRLCESAIHSRNGRVLHAVLAIVNRSGLDSIDGKRILALISEQMPVWEPKDCPLCEQGSYAIPPKIDNNWALLNAVY